MANLIVNAEKCVGCRICEMVCSMMHLGFFNPRKALIRVEMNRLAQIISIASEIDIPMVCLQCNPAPCAEACPSEAIEKVPTGAWIVNEEKCTGCGSCVEVCSYGMIILNSKKNIAIKCDLCNGKPSCVLYCPTGALVY